MDSARVRQRLLEIQAELAELDPSTPEAAGRAQELREEIADLAARGHARSTPLAARAFGDLVTPTGYDAPVEALDSFVDSLASAPPAEQPGGHQPRPTSNPHHPRSGTRTPDEPRPDRR